MKQLMALLVVVLAFTAQRCQSTGKSTTSSAAAAAPTDKRLPMLKQTWLHSREEDEGDIEVYRPNSYDFPPARGRTGFEFKDGGQFVQYDIAPTDGLQDVPGKFTLEGNTIKVTFLNSNQPGYSLEIVSLDQNLLKVRRK